MPSDTRPPENHDIYVGEGPEVYCANFTKCPTLTNGGTISNPTVVVDVPRVTLGTPQVTTQVFTQLDENGNTIGTVAIGKGVTFTVTGVVKGQCEVKCQVSGSDGQKPIVATIFVVRI